ncbi:3-oxoacyl-ACP synthase [Candidatus Poribacteria bacterium]|nr:3-oxoacyl-ACP synthase [Candidatus Poribacteria bacterium]
MRLSEARLKEIEAIPDEEIDTSEIPELSDDFWQNAQMIVPPNNVIVERDVFEWFKTHAIDVSTQINAVLRDYVSAHQNVA